MRRLTWMELLQRRAIALYGQLNMDPARKSNRLLEEHSLDGLAGEVLG